MSKEHDPNLIKSSFIIVGAGAAGCAAAKCFAAAGLAQDTLLIEQHSEPGGCAGYFSRGQPRRSFDAGATQLIECQQGQLQRTLFELAPAAHQPSADTLFEPIPTITQHWPALQRKITLHQSGDIVWSGLSEATPQEQRDLARLQTFFNSCLHEAQWMWSLLGHIPRFPPQSWTDILRALALFWKVPLSKKIFFPFLFLANCQVMLRRFGIRSKGLAHDVIKGLLIDTTQNTPEDSPWLASAMGISILRRGIFRCKGGMRSYFRPMVSSFIERGGTYRTHERLTQIQTTDSGFRLSFVNQKTNELKIFEAHRAVLLNLTVWDVVNGLIPDNDPLRTSSVFKRWQRSALAEKGWGAFAIYAIADDQSAWPALPHYHQIFPHPDDPSELKSSLYVSIPARDDPSQPKGMRTLTATIHIPCGDISAEQRQQWTTSLVQRIENSLMTKLTHIETAQPATFAHYTGRRLGQVGGFPLRLRNFLFFSVPSRISHPTLKNCQLLLMGDTVFPGQGVVACSVSGIAAFERATELSFEKIKDSSINFRKTT